MLQKLFTFFIYLFIFSLFLISCNNNNDKKTPQESLSPDRLVSIDNTINADSLLEKCSDVGPFVIKQNIAEDLMKHFDTVYRGFGTPTLKLPLVDSFWVDSIVVVSVADFLVNNPGFDGVRVHFGAQSDAKKTATILISPTIERVSSPTNKGHEDKWGENMALPPGARSVFNNFVHSNAATPANNIDFPKLNPMNILFEEEYRERLTANGLAKRDSLSKAVWFNRCVVLTLSRFLRNPGNKLNGISIYAAAYRDSTSFNTNHTQIRLNQSTFIIVPTSSTQNGHTDNWNIIPNSFMKSKRFEERFNANGFNHGELCPNSCN